MLLFEVDRGLRWLLTFTGSFMFCECLGRVVMDSEVNGEPQSSIFWASSSKAISGAMGAGLLKVLIAEIAYLLHDLEEHILSWGRLIDVDVNLGSSPARDHMGLRCICSCKHRIEL